jgi:hypothetical protein
MLRARSGEGRVIAATRPLRVILGQDGDHDRCA